MDLGQRLRKYREKQNYSQDELAQKLFVTRQAISRWENNKTIPSLYSLTRIADLYQIPVETLLKEDEYTVTKKIDKQVNRGKIYRNIILVAITIFAIFLGVLSYGRKNQIANIDRFNPFIKTEIGYAIVPVKKGQMSSEEVDARVTSDPFGGYEEWLKVNPLEIPDKQRHYVVVMHRGSYIIGTRLISRDTIPKLIRQNMETVYETRENIYGKDAPSRGHLSPFN